MTKKKSTVNKAGNYTKPGMRKKYFKESNQEVRVVLQVSGLHVKHNY